LATKGVKAIPRRLSALPPKRTFDSSCGMSALCQTQRELDWHKKTIGMYGVSYVNFARSTEGETYRDQAPAIRLRRSRRAVRCKAQGWPTTAAALSPLCDRSGGDPVRCRGATGRRAGRLDAGRRPALRWRRHSAPLRERRFPTATASGGVIASGQWVGKGQTPT